MKKYEDPLARSIQTREIVKRLRTDIILNKYKPGSRLIEAKIAEQQGISRAPVRASLQILAQEGLVINLSNGGTEVIGFTMKHVVDLFDLRIILEKKALESIIASKSFQYKPLLDFMDIFESFNRNSDISKVTSFETSQFDLQFHRSLVMMSDNNPILAAWNTMANLLQAILEITNITHSSFQEFYEEHKKLAELVIQKNPACIVSLEEHITNAKEILVVRMSKFSGK
jgi:DNA-binding GntR family transcriptional regulator